MAIDTIKSSAVLDGAIATADIADNAVTTAKITDANITTAKVADDAITGAKIENNPTIAGNLTVSGAFTSQGIDDNADATAMTISSDEDVMIGTTDESSGAKFIVGSTSDDKRAFIQGSNQYRLGLKNGSNNHVWLGSGGADNFRVSNSSGSTLFELNSSGNIVLPTSSAGIHLGVTSATASNLLDDYEEGTWTPAFQSTSASFSYSVQGGDYTKIGRLVFANFRIQLSGAPSGTTSNVVFIGGLPFVIGSLNGTYHGGHPGHYYNFNLNTGASKHGTLAYQLPQGESKVELKVVGDNLGETAVLASHLNSTAQIRGQILYHTT